MTEEELAEVLSNYEARYGSRIRTHCEVCWTWADHAECTVPRLAAEVRRQRQEIAEWTNAARKVFKGPQDAKTQEEYDRRYAEMEKEGLAALEALMSGNGWANVESESTMAHMARQIEESRSRIDRLREALTWAVGFCQCNFPKCYAEYEGMRNAASLVDGKSGLLSGEFQRVSCRAEVAEYERDQLKKLLTQHGIEIPEDIR